MLATMVFFIMPIELVSNEVNHSSEDSFVCPGNLQQLTSLLLQDLPSYTNRVIQRTQPKNRQAGIRNYIVTASQAEFEPLNLPRIQYNSINTQKPEQVFFTVLEKQYNNNKITKIRTYYWLFLTQTSDGWRMVMMFSRFGNSNTNNPPTPPIETSNGIIGRGVQLWLNDCRAGTIRMRVNINN